jgi:hypothetical protein
VRRQIPANSSDGLYSKESDLVRDFLLFLKQGESPWGNVATTTEWDYRTGITDVLARTSEGHLVAFEAKLTDWRRATQQAYRNTTFVKQAYVVMPALAAERAMVHQDVFSRYGVGLCSVQENGVSIVIEAPELDEDPILPWMKRKANLFFDEVAAHGTRIARKNRNGSLQWA